MIVRTTLLWRRVGVILLLVISGAFGAASHDGPAFGLTMESCPPPVDASLIYLPCSHIRNLVGQYHNYIEHFCSGCQNCIVETYNRYANHFLLRGPGTCWGYETHPECPVNNRFLPAPTCTVLDDQEVEIHRQMDLFYKQGDFGYVQAQREQLKVICAPAADDDGMLECTNNAQFCRGRNVMINFRDLEHRPTPVRYHTDVLKHGDIGAKCQLNRTALRGRMEYMSPLQSWAPELRNFVDLTHDPTSSLRYCDVIIDRPTFIMKVDATNNMYHHFCDFFNLYAAQHVNNSDPTAFSTDVNILIWETYPYKTPFSVTFGAFTQHPIMTLKDVAGHNVCFRKLVLPLLPRMIFGMYYNTPLESNCGKSALFDSFSEHILHRLRVPLHAKPRPFRIRVTFLERKTLYRKIVNSRALVARLSQDETFQVEHVEFETLSFIEQLETIRNTDILVGIHGAGLTHLLFLPKWATLFELYNCGDPGCYRDLARLRGIDYITWERPEKISKAVGPNRPDTDEQEKFMNYSFDPAEFVRIMGKAVDNLYRQPDFKQYLGAKPSDITFEERMYGKRSMPKAAPTSHFEEL